MISTEDLYEELKKYEALIEQPAIAEVDFKKAMIKLTALQCKLLHNIRTNSVLCMQKLGVEPVKPKRARDTA